VATRDLASEKPSRSPLLPIHLPPRPLECLEPYIRDRLGSDNYAERADASIPARLSWCNQVTETHSPALSIDHLPHPPTHRARLSFASQIGVSGCGGVLPAPAQGVLRGPTEQRGNGIDGQLVGSARGRKQRARAHVKHDKAVAAGCEQAVLQPGSVAPSEDEGGGGAKADAR